MEPALRAAEAARFHGTSPGFAEFEQARAAREAALLLLDRGGRLRHSNGELPALSLLRDAARWALAAHLRWEDQGIGEGASGAELWGAFEATAAPRHLETLDDEIVARARSLTAEPAAPRAVGSDGAERTADVEALVLVVDRLLAPLETAAARVARIRVERWVRIALVTVALLAAVSLPATWLLGGLSRSPSLPNLALGRPTEASSLLDGYDTAAGAVDGQTESLGFATRRQDQPWLQIDLGAERTVRAIRVYNRADCCQEEALPLVIELSTDGERYTEAGRRDKWFWTWLRQVRSTRARYVKLRVDGKATLNLNEVEVFGSVE